MPRLGWGTHTHHAWSPIKDVDKKLVANVGPTKIRERPPPRRIALLPALLDDEGPKRGERPRPRSEPAAAENGIRNGPDVPRGAGSGWGEKLELTDCSEDE
jgi:hypothetical protein